MATATVKESPKYDEYYRDALKILAEAELGIEDIKRRFFPTSNYKKSQSEDAPGKREFNMIKTEIKNLERPFEAIRKKHLPAAPKKNPDGPSHNGFNRLCYTSEALTKHLGLDHFGLIAEDGIRGIATPGIITRRLVNDVNFGLLTNPKKPSIWRADDTFLKLFKNEWDDCEVDRNEITYTSLQKLIAPHLETVTKDAPERKDEKLYNSYYEILDPEKGSLGRPSVDALKYRNRIDEIRGVANTLRREIYACEKYGFDAEDIAPYKKSLADLQEEFDSIVKKTRKLCKDNNFPISDKWPTPLVE